MLIRFHQKLMIFATGLVRRRKDQKISIYTLLENHELAFIYFHRAGFVGIFCSDCEEYQPMEHAANYARALWISIRLPKRSAMY